MLVLPKVSVLEWFCCYNWDIALEGKDDCRSQDAWRWVIVLSFLIIDIDNKNNNHQLLMSRYKTLLIVLISKQQQMKSLSNNELFLNRWLPDFSEYLIKLACIYGCCPIVPLILIYVEFKCPKSLAKSCLFLHSAPSYRPLNSSVSLHFLLFNNLCWIPGICQAW